MKILAFAGSLRKESLNRKLLKRAIFHLPKDLVTVNEINLEGFPLPAFDEDLETSNQFPENAKQLGQLISDHNAVIIASPEYNYSIPGHLKNTIDWVSRIRPIPFSKIPVLLLSASPGMVGGARGLWALRVPLEAIGNYVYPGMLSLSKANEAFHSDGSLKDEKVDTSLKKLTRDFVEFANRLTVQK